jgi:hypothetical protein
MSLAARKQSHDACTPQKITLAEMRSTGVLGPLIYCADYRCSHSIAISADDWSDDVRLSAIWSRALPARPAGTAARMFDRFLQSTSPPRGISLTVERSISINLRTVVRPPERSRFALIFNGCLLVAAMKHYVLPPPTSPTWVLIASIIMVLCAFGFILSLSGLV